MSRESNRNFTRLAMAVVVAAIIVAGTVLSYSSLEVTATKTVSTTTTVTLQTIVIRADTNTTFSTTSCTLTGPGVVGCPGIYNRTYTYSVSYNRPWGGSYQVFDVPGTTGTPIESNDFYGYGPANVTVHFLLYTTGYAVCVNAQKLDASDSTLTLAMYPEGGGTNSTALPFGKASLCLIAEQG